MKQSVINIQSELKQQTLDKIQELFGQGDIFLSYVTLADFLNRFDKKDSEFLALKESMIEFTNCNELLFNSATVCMIDALQNKKLFTRNDIYDVFKSLIDLDDKNSLKLFIDYENLSKMFEQFEKSRIREDKNYVPYFSRRCPSNIEKKLFSSFQKALQNKKYQEIIDGEISKNNYYFFDVQILKTQAYMQLDQVEKAQNLILNLQDEYADKSEYIFYTLYFCYKKSNNKAGMVFYKNKLLFLSKTKQFLHNFQTSLLNELLSCNNFNDALDLVNNFLKFEQFDSYLLAYKCMILAKMEKYDELATSLEYLDIICHNDKTAYFMLKELKINGSLTFDSRFELSDYMKNQIYFLFKKFLDLATMGEKKDIDAFLTNNFNFNAVIYVCLGCNLTDKELEQVFSVNNEKLNRQLLSILHENAEDFNKKFQVMKTCAKATNQLSYFFVHDHFFSEIRLLPETLLIKQSKFLFEAYYDIIAFIYNNNFAKPFLSHFLNLSVELVINNISSKNVALLNDKKALMCIILTIYFSTCYDMQPNVFFKDEKTIPFGKFDKIASTFGFELVNKQFFINNNLVDLHELYLEYIKTNKL